MVYSREWCAKLVDRLQWAVDGQTNEEADSAQPAEERLVIRPAKDLEPAFFSGKVGPVQAAALSTHAHRARVLT